MTTGNSDHITPLELKPQNRREGRRLQSLVGSMVTLRMYSGPTLREIRPGEDVLVVSGIRFQKLYIATWQQTRYRMVVTVLHPETCTKKEAFFEDYLRGNKKPSVRRFLKIFNRYFTNVQQ